MTSSNSSDLCRFWVCLDINCVGTGNDTENAQSMIVRPGLSFNFHLSEIHFLKKFSAHLFCNKECFPKRFEPMLHEI